MTISTTEPANNDLQIKPNPQATKDTGKGLLTTKTQIIFAAFAVAVILIFVPFTLEAQKYLAYYKPLVPEGYDWPDFSEFWFTGVVMIITMIVQRIIEEMFYPCFYKINKEKVDIKKREARTRKAVKCIFKALYMTCSSIAGWYTLKDSFILPPSLGGSGSLYNAFETFPFVKLPVLYRLYFTGSMGYHVGGLLTHMMAKEKTSDYVEMMFHHLVTFYLYAFSFLTNQIIGGVIAYLHDIADIFVSITRMSSETEYKKTTSVFMVLTIIAWFHSRLYVFSQCIYIVTWKLQVFAVSPYLKPIFGFLLFCLFILHVYWFVLCIKIMLAIILTGKTEDLSYRPEETTRNLMNGKPSQKHQQPQGTKKLE